MNGSFSTTRIFQYPRKRNTKGRSSSLYTTRYVTFELHGEGARYAVNISFYETGPRKSRRKVNRYIYSFAMRPSAFRAPASATRIPPRAYANIRNCERGRNSRGLCRGIVLRQACVYAAREKGETINAAAGAISALLYTPQTPFVVPRNPLTCIVADFARSLKTTTDNGAAIGQFYLLRFYENCSLARIETGISN